MALVVVEIPLGRSLDTNSIPDGQDSQLGLALSVVVGQWTRLTFTPQTREEYVSDSGIHTPLI